MARFGDLRDYLGVLESLGDVERIDRPVSAVLEAAAITRRSTEQRRPAPLFDNVEGFSPGSVCWGRRVRCRVIAAIP
jgi:UbiD family decarboxylase